jgi:asparagine synthase (glutamine-hydrolysing)
LARSVHEHGYKVALTGEGADEWLAGYLWFKTRKLVAWMDKIPFLPLGYGLHTLFVRVTDTARLSYPAYRQLLNALGGASNGWVDMYGVLSTNKLKFFNRAAKEVLEKQSPFDDLELAPDLYRWHPFHRQLYFGSRVLLPGHLLAAKGDRVAMHSSVETRYAFLDEDLIAYIATLHPRWKLRGLLKDKFVERRVAERWLPQPVAWRAKKMFQLPTDSWNAGGCGSPTGAKDSWIAQVLSPESVRKAGYFDPDTVTTARRKLAQPGGGLARPILALGLTAVLSTQLWHHLYLSGDLCDLPGLGLHDSTHARR